MIFKELTRTANPADKQKQQLLCLPFLPDSPVPLPLPLQEDPRTTQAENIST